MLTPQRDLVPDKKKGIPRSAIITGIVLGILCGFLIRSIIHGFFFYPYKIKNDLMAPGLLPGEKVTIDLRFEPSELRRGDILLLAHPAYPEDERYLFARLVGLPGESIKIEDRIVYINGRALKPAWEQEIQRKTRYLNPQPFRSPNQRRDQLPSLTLQAEQVFVLADNRRDANDSRQLGPFFFSQIRGLVHKQSN